jgi:hypothetical protein
MLDANAAGERMHRLIDQRDKSASYPATDLASRLSVIADLLKSRFGARVYNAQQSGYDTHVSQAGEQARLLGDLSDALLAFLDDLAAKLPDGNAGQPQAEVEVPVGRLAHVAIRRPAVPGVEAPAAASAHPVRGPGSRSAHSCHTLPCMSHKPNLFGG